jgi:hypothetical protein
MMTDQPSRITISEISDALDAAWQPDTGGLRDQITWHTRKALLLDELAGRLGTPDAYLAAADAWQQVADLCAPARQEVTT